MTDTPPPAPRPAILPATPPSTLPPAALPEDAKRKRKNILLLATSFYCVLLIANVSYFLPLYYTKAGFSPQASGWLVTSFYIASVSSRLFLGNVITALGFRRVFLLAGVLSLACSLGVALAGPMFWAAFFSRAGLGLGISLFQVGLATYQALAFSKEERAGAYSVIMAGGLAPMMTAVPLADWLLFNGYDSLYILLPVASCIGALAVTMLIPSTRETVFQENAAPARNPLPGPSHGPFHGPFHGMADCFKIPFFRLALVSLFLFTFTDAISAFMSPMVNSYGLAASLFLSANAVVGVAVRLFLGRVLDRYPRRKLSVPILVSMLVALLLASIDPSATTLVVLGMVFGVGMGFGFPLNLALVSDGIPPHLQPQAVSMAWFVMGCNFGAVPLILGWLGSAVGPVAAFRLVAGAALFGACLLALLWRKHPEIRES